MHILRYLFAALALLIVSSAATAQTPRGARVEVNGMQMYYEVSGRGEPLIVLHGAHMNIETMGEIIPRLAQHRRVYALEFQGHGRTNDINRAITYQNLADDVVAFMDAVGIERADVFGYSMGASAGLQIAIRHSDRINKLIMASAPYDLDGWQPAYQAFMPQMNFETFAGFEIDWRRLAPNPQGYRPFIEKMIALEHEPMAWQADVRALRTPVLLITGDADVVTLEHSVALFRLLGGGVMGDMGQPLPPSRLAVLPATSHTAIITQVDLLEPLTLAFLNGQTPRGMFESDAQ